MNVYPAIFWFAVLMAEFAVGADSRPNIILILADDLGYSDLGCYGGEIETPHLDGLAAHGLRMTQLYNTARCCSTRASLLTGLYPHQAGVGAMTADNRLPERPLFFEHEGNRAIRLGKWKLVWTNFEKRWELYDISADRCEINDLAAAHPAKVREMEKLWLDWAKRSFVQTAKVEQPAKGMPTIYYLKN